MKIISNWKLGETSKAVLSMLIYEVKDWQNRGDSEEELTVLLNAWVAANDLHLELVEELKEALPK